MVQRGNCSWAMDTYKMAVDTVARGAVEATGMQIQFISTLIPDKMCLLAYFLPVGLKATSDPFSAQIYLGFLGTLISLHFLEHSSAAVPNKAELQWHEC